MLAELDELEYLSSATLTKRKDFLDREEEARGAPNRVLYYRRNADHDRLISACTSKLEENPTNVRALLLRAASYVKKGESIPSKLCINSVLHFVVSPQYMCLHVRVQMATLHSPIKQWHVNILLCY